jgi:hypothetical protein
MVTVELNHKYLNKNIINNIQQNPGRIPHYNPRILKGSNKMAPTTLKIRPMVKPTI